MGPRASRAAAAVGGQSAGRPRAAFGGLQGSRQSLLDGPQGQPFGSLRVAADMVPGTPSIGDPTL